MKKILFAMCAAAALMAVSCQKSESVQQMTNEVKLVPVTLTVGMANEDGTKVSKDGLKLAWKPGDQIAVATRVKSAERYILTTVEGGNPAVFTGEVDSKIADGSTACRAFYPNDIVKTVSSTTNFQVAIGETQVGVKDQIPDKTMMLHAWIDDFTKGFSMTPICGLVEVSVKGNDVKRIELTSGTGLTFTVLNVNLSNGNIGADSKTNVSTKILKLLPEEGKETFEPGTYYFTVAGKVDVGKPYSTPAIKYVKSDGTEWVKKSENTVTIYPGQIIKFNIDEDDCECTSKALTYSWDFTYAKLKAANTWNTTKSADTNDKALGFGTNYLNEVGGKGVLKWFYADYEGWQTNKEDWFTSDGIGRFATNSNLVVAGAASYNDYWYFEMEDVNVPVGAEFSFVTSCCSSTAAKIKYWIVEYKTEDGDWTPIQATNTTTVTGDPYTYAITTFNKAQKVDITETVTKALSGKFMLRIRCASLQDKDDENVVLTACGGGNVQLRTSATISFKWTIE